MKRFNATKKLLTIVGSLCLVFTILVSPVASMPSVVQAAAPKDDVAQPQHDIIAYRYKIEGNKMYKRLYNYTINEWIGDWIFMGYVN